MTEFDYEFEGTVRYADLDTYGHVNNAVYLTYCEEARIAFVEDVLDYDPSDAGMVVAHVEIDYERPIEGTGAVAVGVKAVDIGGTSFTLAYELAWCGERVATAESVQVVLDPETDAPTPVPEDWRDRLRPES